MAPSAKPIGSTKVAQADAPPPPKDDAKKDPAKKDEPKKGDAKVGGEVKAGGEVKVGGDAKVPDGAKQPDAPNPDAPKDTYVLSPWKTPSRYSAGFEVGYGGANMGNEQGIDHGGAVVGGQLGLVFDAGDSNQFALRPYGFFRNRWLSKNLGVEGLDSKAQAFNLGVGFDFIYRPIRWFGVGGGLEVGATHWTADTPKLDMLTGISTGGVEINANGSVVGMDTWSAHIAPQIKLCTMGLGICLNGQLYFNPGGSFKRDFIDVPKDSQTKMAFDPMGVAGTIMFDVPQIIGFFTDEHKPRSKPVEDTPRKTEDKGAEPAPVKPDGDKPAPKVDPAPAPTKVLSVSELAASSKALVEKAETARKNTDGPLADAKVESKKSSPDVGTLRIYAKTAMDRSTEATAAAKESRALVTQLEEKVKTSEGDEKKAAQAALKTAKENQSKIDADAAKAYANAKETHDIYAKKAGKDNDLDIAKLETPPGGVTPAKPKVPYVPPKDDKKDKKPDDKKPDDKKPDDKKKPDEKKPDDKKPGGPLKWGTGN